MAEIYLILGAEGAGRRDAVRDLIEGGFEDDEINAVAIHESEPDSPADEQLLARASNCVIRFTELVAIEIPTEAEAAFLIAPGRGNPLDAVEALYDWLKQSGHSLARIITVVHCALLAENPKLGLWHKACIHFSDVVLFNRRETVSNKWFSEFKDGYVHERYPCLFELMKKGRVRNPPLVLEPQPRRMSLTFDDDIEAVDLIDFDEENLPDEPVDLTRPIDPWLKRLPSGQWEQHLPPVANFLPPRD